MSADATATRLSPGPAACTPADAAAFAAAELARLARGGQLAYVVVPAPLAPPETLLALAPDELATLWAAPHGTAMAGLGAAARIEVRGDGRLAELRARADALWPRVRTSVWAGCDDPIARPRLLGGLAFAPGSADEPAWAAFGDGSFVLPRLAYVTRDGRAYLAVAGDAHDPALPALVHRALVALASPPALPRPRAGTRRVEQLPLAPWAAQIDAIRAAIRDGSFDKIVAARRGEIHLDTPVDPAVVVARLSAAYPDCFRFGFRRGGAAFVGATPEVLIEKRGAAIETAALAGSIEVGDDGDGRSVPAQGDALRTSAKDLAEHRFVVRAIVHELAPLCEQLDATAQPEICELRHVLHLRTPVRGRLRSGVHVLDLVRALHPTPAVGGVPTAEAVRWIVEREASARGWYAGPVGWLDAAGDGAFAVALRSGLLQGERAYVYAGAGIVADSDAAAEYAETDLKQRALLGALGVLA